MEREYIPSSRDHIVAGDPADAGTLLPNPEQVAPERVSADSEANFPATHRRPGKGRWKLLFHSARAFLPAAWWSAPSSRNPDDRSNNPRAQQTSAPARQWRYLSENPGQRESRANPRF